MGKFKQDDIVECVEPDFGGNIRKGIHYRVYSVFRDDEHIALAGVLGLYHQCRFRLVVSPVASECTGKCTDGCKCMPPEKSEAPKLDLTKPVQTRDGRAVRILCTDYNSISGKCVVGLLFVPHNGHELTTDWYADGRWTGYSVSPWDLVNVPPKPLEATNEVLLYRTKAGHLRLHIHDVSASKKMTAAAQKRILGRRTITIKEGEGL